MKFTIFLRKFGVLASIVVVLTFVHKVGCDVEGIVDLEYEENDVFEETTYEHDEKDRGGKVDLEKGEYNTHDSGQRRMYAGYVYKEMFQKHRLAQHEATKAVTKFGDYEKRYHLVSRMLYQLFETLEDVKKNATLFDIHAGDLFPEEEEEASSISKIFENVFLFGDLILRMPDMVHAIYDRKEEWRFLIGWALDWCQLSNFFEGPAKVILEIIYQETNIRPRQDDWKPDYSNMTEVEFDLVKTFYETHVLSKELGKAKIMAALNEKKEKKKIKKGPRMSREDL